MKYMLSRFGFLVGLLAIAVQSGCVTTRFAHWNDEIFLGDPQSQEEGKRLEKEGDILFEARQVNSNLYGALVKWEVASQFSPSRELFLKLARGHFYLAEASSTKNYDDALRFSERALALFAPNFIASLKKGLPFEAAVREVMPSGAEALLVYAKSLEKWSAQKGPLTRLYYRTYVNAATSRTSELGFYIDSDGQPPDSDHETKR